MLKITQLICGEAKVGMHIFSLSKFSESSFKFRLYVSI